MRTRRPAWLGTTLMFCLLAPVPTGAARQDAPPTTSPGTPPDAQAPSGDEAASFQVRFTFKDAPLDQVIDFFARETGLPVIRETDLPDGTVTFISAHAYPLDEAMRILNTILQTRGILLRRDGEFLYLGKLDDQQREAVPTFTDGEIPDGLTGEQIVSVVVPLNNAAATPIAEQLKPLVAGYGAIVPLPAQNSLIITESVSQCRRLRAIIDALDEKPAFEETVEVFPLTHIKANDAVESLKVLVAEKKTTVVFDQQGNRRVVSEDDLAGVRMQADERTNSIIVLGSDARIRTVERLLSYLDVEGTGALPSEMATFELATLSADEAVRHINQTFARTPEDKRPTVIPMSRFGRLTIIGTSAAIAQVQALIAELEGTDPATASSTTQRVAVVPLEHVDANAAVNVIRSLLNARQQQTLKITAAPGGRGVVIAGPGADIETAREVVASIDAPAIEDREFRVIRLGENASATLIEKAQKIYSETSGLGAGDVAATFDREGRSLSIIGSRKDLERFASIVRTLDDAAPGETETRTYQSARLRPSQVAQSISRAAQVILAPGDGSPYTPPVFEPADSMGMLIIRATPRQFAVIDSLYESLEQASAESDADLRLFRLKNADINATVNTLRRLAQTGALMPPGGARDAGNASFEVEPASRTIIASAPEAAFERIEQVIAEFEGAPQTPETRLIFLSLTSARAEQIAGVIDQVMNARTREIVRQSGLTPDRAGGLVSVTPDRATNSLVITVPEALVDEAREMVARLDSGAAVSRDVVRIVSLTFADAGQTAQALGQTLRTARLPSGGEVSVSAAGASNALVLSGAENDLDWVINIVNQLDQKPERDALGVRTVYLKHARAERLAPLVEKLLNGETMAEWVRLEMMRRRRPGEEDNRARVVAEPRLNALTITGSPDQLSVAEEIVGQLDADAGGSAVVSSVRIITLTNADANEVAANITAVMSEDESGDVPPTIRVDRTSNALIVRGSDEQFATIDALVSSIDQAAAVNSRQIRTLRLDPSRADAAAIARSLAEMLREQGGVEVEVITADELLDRAGAGDSGSEPVSRRNDAPETGLPEFGESEEEARRGVLLPKRVKMILNYVQTVIAVAPEAGEGVAAGAAAPAGAGGGLTIAVDSESNTLIIVGSDRVTQRAEQIARAIERDLPRASGKIRLVELPSGADANQMIQIVRATLSQADPTNIMSRVTMVPHPDGDAVLIASSDQDFEKVARVIAVVARPEMAESFAVRVYPLSTVSAGRAAQAVNDLVSSAPTGRQASRFRRNGSGREFELSIPMSDGTERLVSVDPSMVRVASGPGDDALIVTAPSEVLPAIDRFIELLDQSPVEQGRSIRTYALANAGANETAQTLSRLFSAAAQGNRNRRGNPQFIADERTASILFSGTDGEHDEVSRLIELLDAPTSASDAELALIHLESAQPSRVRTVLEQAMIGKDNARRERVSLSAEDSMGLLIVRAPAEEMEEARAIIAELDRADVGELPVRSIKLERANAESVAVALQRFFDDRARAQSRPGRNVARRIAIIGDRRSSTLVVSASDDDYAQVQMLVQTFDASSVAKDLQFRVIPLEHARIADVGQAIDSIAGELQWATSPWQAGDNAQTLIVHTDERLNSVIVLGTGEAFEKIDGLIKALDTPMGEREKMSVRVVKVANADLRVVRTALERVFADPNAARRWWEPEDPRSLKVETDPATRSLILIAPEAQLDEAATLIAQLDQTESGPDIEVQTVALTFADAERAGRSLSRFFDDRARLRGLDRAGMSVIGSRDGNTLILAGAKDEIALARDILSRLDQPGVNEDRTIEVYALSHGEAPDVARAIARLFPTQGDQGTRVTATSDVRTNSVIVSAPNDLAPQVQALITQMDTPPAGETVRLRTFALTSARAEEVAQTIRTALDLKSTADARAAALQGIVRTFLNEQGEEVVIRASVTPDRRSNALIVSADDASMEIVSKLISQLDEQPAVAETEYRVLTLKHAKVDDVDYTLSGLLRRRGARPGETPPSISASIADNTLIVAGTTDQIAEIEKILSELDRPSATKRETEFIPLQFADAEATRTALKVFYGRYAPEAATPGALNVSIVADPATNSLVISADESEWPGIRALLTKLDSEEYDASRRLEVIALKHADAQSVASALQQAFDAPLRAEVERERQRQLEQANRRGGNNDPRFFESPAVLVDTDELVSVSAEPVTNSLIVSAGRKDLERVRAIVERLDVPGFAQMPAPRVLAIKVGRATDVARVLTQMYELTPNGARARTLRTVSIVGDDNASALIVRASDEEYSQIKALADALQQEREVSQVTVRVMALHRQPAARLVQTILRTFAATAQRENEPLAVEADRTSNSLIIASSKRIYDEIERVVRELDGPAPGNDEGDAEAPIGLPGQGVFIIEVKNSAPDDVKRMLEQMGLTRPAPADRPGIVSEPINIVTMTTRRAIAVTAAPVDGPIVAELVRSLDADPISPEQEIALVPLRVANAQNVATTLERLLAPGNNDAATALARSIAEQVRRLKIRGQTLETPDISLDLTTPIRIDAEAQTNSILVSSSANNVAAIKQVVDLLDRLPIGDAVVVRVFHLENASSDRLAGVVRELFQQGESIRRTPGTEIRGEPTTVTGKALAGEIAVAIDDRTNALIIAGREEAVALAEVLIDQLDSSETANWIEPRLIPLRFADARSVSETLTRVLVQGLGDTPEAAALRRQVGRLRLVAKGQTPDAAMESQIFAPMTRLLIEPEEQLNALIVVGSTSNVDVVAELVKQLDVEGASWAESVRVYPLRFAAADRVADLLRGLFDEQVDRQTLRKEDDLSIYPDLRSNSLVIATSQRSFAVVDQLLKTLDAEGMRATVGVHIVPVGKNDARQLAPKIERLMRAKLDALPRGARSGNDVVSIQPDEATNTLIVAASDENLAIVRQLIEALGDEELDTDSVLDIFPLRLATATDMVRLLNELYVDEVTRTRGEASLRVRADERLNAVVVNGSQEDIESIRELIQRLDGSEYAGVREIKVIPLASAHALEMVNLLENVLSGRSIGGSRQSAARQATILRFVRDRAARELGNPELTETEVSAAIREQVTLTPDLRTNAVVVSAPPPMMIMIETLIDDLDSSAAGARKIRVFELANSDAEQMAELLRDLFNLRRQGNLFVLVPTGTAPTPSDDPGAMESLGLGDLTLTMVPDERQELAITIDPRTNSLLVSGTAQYLDLVSEVVNSLDSQKGVEREQITYELKNARVEEVSNALQTFIRQEQDRISRVLGPDQQGSAIRRLENEISVVGVPGSSRLILSASPRYMDTVMAIIEELDRAPAQVMIQVLLAEVTLDSEQNWGVDFVLNPQGSRSLEGALRAAGTGVLTAIGVPNLSVSTLDFDLLIRALEIEGKLEVLSRPQVLVNDNEDALIQVGENIQLVTNIQRTDSGNTISTTAQESIGVILRVTPSISPDGFVRMDIEPEISALTARTTQISEDFEAPIISTRRAETTVTVKDGQTIVIGGLIQSQNELRKTKIPGLGDIPVIGNVFKSSVTSSTKTELVIVLRPRVIVSDRDMRGRTIEDISRSEVDRMSLSPEVKEQLDEQMFEAGQEGEGVQGQVENSRGWKTTIRTGRGLREDDGTDSPEGEWTVEEVDKPMAPGETIYVPDKKNDGGRP
ncbi:MAG: hypothetical protein H6812_08515 [Phycisphaeraceae bacterium]|nr:hypothetical protein [Phycisphaerales bacterium]MCB9843287.1 hypothetical protein [Phycisphaeraceae bacterium]